MAVVCEIAGCTSFESLLSLVTGRTREIKGFGKLAQYDTTLRIAAFSGTYPKKVHLHAGVLAGARA